MLEAGSPAPPLVLEDTEGRAVRLADFRGEHAGDVRVLVVVPEDRETAAAWRAKHRIPFPVLTGRDATPHEVIGLSRAVFGTVQRSGSVLVDAEGIVRHAHGTTLPTGSYDRAGIAAALGTLA